MRERTVTISGLSKTFSCTGWRLGYAIAPPTQTAAIRKVHDFLTVGAPAPLQAAGAVGLSFDADYFNHLALDYRARRHIMVDALAEAGFTFGVPKGPTIYLRTSPASATWTTSRSPGGYARRLAWRPFRARAFTITGSSDEV
jgi:aspartate/methionine/tyrosine aminotransferase